MKPETNMTQEQSIIGIKTTPQKTGKGPVWDFIDAVAAEQSGSYATNQLYQFGNVIVRFFEHDRRPGMDFMRPANSKGTPNLYSVTRISTTGKRSELGHVVLSINQP